MIRAAPTPRYSDERQQKLHRHAHGKCSAGMRTVGAKLFYFAMVDGDFIDDPDRERGFDTHHDAVKRAQDYRAWCNEQLAEPSGSA